MKPYKYSFYPSLLDAYQRYLDVDYDTFLWQDEAGAWHQNYNESSGEYHYSPEEVDALAKQELIDLINRVKKEPNEYVSKGTAFNECVDCLIHKTKSKTLKTEKLYNEEHKVYAIRCFINGFVFDFDLELLKQVASDFEGSLSQVYCETDVDTMYGRVHLYGFIDELDRNLIVDIKTTKSYTFGNYKKHWQRHIYPLCVVGSGSCTEINMFEFYVVKLKGGTTKSPVISGDVFKEDYTFIYEYSMEMVVQQCERFIEFLEENKDLITDKKIFGLQ